MVAETFISTLVGSIKGAAIVESLSALAAALFSFGIPKNSIVQYETGLNAREYLLIAHVTPQDIKNASETVKNNGAGKTARFNSNHAQKKLESYFLNKEQ